MLGKYNSKFLWNGYCWSVSAWHCFLLGQLQKICVILLSDLSSWFPKEILLMQSQSVCVCFFIFICWFPPNSFWTRFSHRGQRSSSLRGNYAPINLMKKYICLWNRERKRERLNTPTSENAKYKINPTKHWEANSREEAMTNCPQLEVTSGIIAGQGLSRQLWCNGCWGRWENQ